MKIKLTPIPVKNNPKNKYIIEVRFMHGDADHYETETWNCKNEKHFIDTMTLIEEGIKRFTYNSYEVRDFWNEVLGEDFVPYDITCDSYKAAICSAKGFYFDESGTKLKAELIP